MTQVDPTGGLAAVIRKQVASLGRASGRGVASRAHARSEVTQDGQSRQSPELPVDIAAVAAGRVQAIDPDDPNRHRKAFHVFLESVLLAEFGENLINDAGFHQLVEDVHSQMEADADLAPAMHAASSRMLEAAPASKPR